MVRKGSKKVGIVASDVDLDRLEYLSLKLGLKTTDIYRLALGYLYRKEKLEG